MLDNFNLNEGKEKIDRSVPKFNFNFNKKFIIPAVMMLAVPLTVGLALTRTNILKFAGGGPAIAEVRVSPGSILVQIDDIFKEAYPETHLSALAFDEFGSPISQYPVSFEWSLSSTDSIGTLSRTQGDLTDFKPMKSGCGQLTVRAWNGDNIVTKSISIVVASGSILPECSKNNPTPTIASQQSRVFVTSTTYDGNLGGLPGADAKCQTRADTVNLGGSWKAWISDTTTSVESRFVHSSGQYKLLNDQVIANNWADLVDGVINYPINRTEVNSQVAGQAWTNTRNDGTINNDNHNPDDLSVFNCNNWTNNSFVQTGRIGYVDNANNWSEFANVEQYCGTKIRLYCFEQIADPTPTPTFTLTPTPTNTPPTPTFTPVPTSAPLKMTINAAADAFVRSTAPSQNFGSTASLELDTNPNEISYLRFNLLNLAGKTIVSAKLRLKVSDASKQILNLRRGKVVEWSETGITYNNRVGFEAVIRNFNATAVDSVVELDVKNAVNLRKGGKINFGITSGGDDTAAFYSRESVSSNKPLLIVEYR